MNKWLIAFLMIEIAYGEGFEEKFKAFREEAEKELKCELRIMAYPKEEGIAIVVAECR